MVENVHGLSMTSSTSLQFVWDPLTCNNINGIFDHYSAVLSRWNSNDKVQTLNAISSSSVTFTALNPCTTYYVTVHAVNRDPLANGRQSAAVSAETKAKGKNIISWKAMKVGFHLKEWELVYGQN